ncbi:hypothetical protein [Paenibacillus bovis]|uniref:Uncharacterized protein n=1 Tax=Paenibacillus bovis TaxID=1616788 RepID=A0A172ZCZ1_9BACL|nr:hypothetical protein [Paenibacillus bovis]ANF95222.1 hypothetical protein AR543_03725 [Paenibacillus bovis]
MSISRGYVSQDYVIQQVIANFASRVLWSEGRPCLEYASSEQLDEITHYVRSEFDWELYDVFFTALEALPEEH